MLAMLSKSILGKLTCSEQFILIEEKNLGLVGPTGKFADSQTLSKKLVTAFITKLLHASAHMPLKLKLSSAPQLTHLTSATTIAAKIGDCLKICKYVCQRSLTEQLFCGTAL